MSDDIQAFVERQLVESLAVKQALLDDEDLRDTITRVCERCIQVYTSGNKILLAGNGGSAADAQHMAAEFVSRFHRDRKALPAIAVTTDPSIVTAISNDYGYEQLFSRQLQAHGQPGDLFIALSTSGNSPNILEALRICPALGITTVGLTGRSGGAMEGLCEFAIHVPSDSTPRIQEGHGLIGHILCAAVEDRLFGAPTGG